MIKSNGDTGLDKRYIRIWNIILIICTVYWATLIFSMSAQNSGDSSSLSLAVSKFIVKTFKFGWSAEDIEYFVRKLAHIAEYAIFAILLTLSAYTFRYGRLMQVKSVMRRRYSVCFAWVVATIYSATDEFHQLFVDGRSGRVTDVFFDSFGAICGVLFTFFILYLVSKKRERAALLKKNEEEDSDIL
mgnify:FL=1